MKKVRKGVFETNSSSMHSIVISEEDDEKYEDYKSRNLSFRDVFETEEDKIVITLRRYDKSVMLDNEQEKVDYIASLLVSENQDKISKYRKYYELSKLEDELIKRTGCAGIKTHVKKDAEVLAGSHGGEIYGMTAKELVDTILNRFIQISVDGPDIC
jgi:hypothetical protein